MDENALTAQARDLASRLIALADEIQQFKHRYDWYTWAVNNQQPVATIDAGVQNMDALQADIHNTRRDPLYNLAYTE